MNPLMNLGRVIEQVSKDKGIEKEVIIIALEEAILSAAKKKFGSKLDLEVRFNEEEGEIEVFQFKTVVDKVENPATEISLEEARRTLDPEAEIGDSLGIKLEMQDFGRIAAQTAKQVIIQRVKDAERENIYAEYKDKKGELVHGIVQRIEQGNVIVNLGRAEAVLPPQEQVPKEIYKQNDRIRALIIDVRRNPREPQIVLSRTHPDFLAKLFEVEVPEVYEGIVEIVSVAREPGSRSKIAVKSNDADVDPVGACVGVNGTRVKSVVQELRGERIDIIPYSEDPVKFVINALAPAVVSEVMVDKSSKTMEVIVSDDQLSLAIGKKGQNVRLAARLTGWNIDVRSEAKLKEITEESMKRLCELPGVGESIARVLFDQGFQSLEALAEADPEELMEIQGVGPVKAKKIIETARQRLQEEKTEKASENEPDSSVSTAASESESEEQDEKPAQSAENIENREAESLENVPGISKDVLKNLKNSGFNTVGDILDTTKKRLMENANLTEEAAKDTIQKVLEYYEKGV